MWLNDVNQWTSVDRDEKIQVPLVTKYQQLTQEMFFHANLLRLIVKTSHFTTKCKSDGVIALNQQKSK